YNIIIAVLPKSKYSILFIVVIIKNILYSFFNIKIKLIVSISSGALIFKYNIYLNNIIVSTFYNKKNSIF
ncbi:hypothetical protein BS50DRAFT_505757, partial [Corynespora cassiicola Philippines]